VRPVGLGKLKKKFNILIGNRTNDFPACSIASQPLRYREGNIIFFKTLLLAIRITLDSIT
jgi:hypothetical protein